MSKGSVIKCRGKLCGHVDFLGVVLMLAALGGCATPERPRTPGAAPIPAPAPSPAPMPTQDETKAESQQNAQATPGTKAIAPAAQAGARKDKPPSGKETAAFPASPDKVVRGINLLPLLRIDTHAGPTVSVMSAGVGGYTRFYVVSTLPPHQSSAAEPGKRKCNSELRRCYSNESRQMWERMLMGRELARVLSVKVDLRNPTIATTTTLASASYESTFSRGESWTTELNGQLLLTPYFRIGNNSVARIEASINASAKGKDQVSGKLLAILQSASQLVAPTSALLTSLNAPRMNQASQFVEQSLSGLFSNAVVEKSSNEFTPTTWNPGAALVTIRADFPMDSNQVTSPTTREIGTWEIRAAAPIISIFSQVPACRPADDSSSDPGCNEKQARQAFASLAPSEVLNFPVAENLTLRQALITDTGVLNAIDDLKKGTGTAESGLARQLCSRLDERAQSLGFNRFDASAIVWAFSQSAGLDAQESAKLLDDQGSCRAAALAKAVGLQ